MEEWRATREAGTEELDFCETSGALGIDPYSVDEKKALEIITVESMLPKELKREFFFAAAPDSLLQQAQWIGKCLKSLKEYEVKTSLAGKRGVYSKLLSSKVPWESGYELARSFRKDFKLRKAKSAVTSEEICGTKKGHLPIVWARDERPLDGVARLDSNLGPQLATTKAKDRESSKKYMLARSLCEYLCTTGENNALLTSVSSDRQKRTRAFAAELLAPAAGIREVLSGSRTTPEEISEIAHHFDVSEWLIQHQIRNHKLAEIEGLKMDAVLTGPSHLPQ